MKITYKGDYALKAILDLSLYYTKNQLVPLAGISKRQNIPEKFLEQIMLILRRGGYVNSKRGKGGGFSLSKPPEQITLGEIIRIIEGPIEPIACGKEPHGSTCGEEDHCPFREVWVEVTAAIEKIVDEVTFADMMRRDREIDQRNSIYNYVI